MSNTFTALFSRRLRVALFGLTSLVLAISASHPAMASSAGLLAPVLGINPMPGINGFADDTGLSGSDGITRDKKLALSGSAGTDAVAVRIYLDNAPIGRVMPARTRQWRFTTPNLVEGRHEFTVSGLSATGTESARSTATVVVIDTTPPSVPTVVRQPNASPLPTLTGLWSGESGNAVSVTVNGIAYTVGNGLTLNGTSWSLALSSSNPLKAGVYDVRVVDQDVAGNVATDKSTAEIVVANQPPVANAGIHRLTGRNALMTLDGSASSDPNGDKLSFRWQLTGNPDGSRVELANPRTAKPTFKADTLGTYTLSLTVSDGRETRVATATVDVVSSIQATVTISASDPNGKPLHYRWKVSQGQIVNVDAPTTTWTLPPGDGVHFANVLVSNGFGGYAARRIAVIADEFGNVTLPPAGRDFEPPADAGHGIAADTLFLVAGSVDAAETKDFGRVIYMPDRGLSVLTLDPVTDLQGRVIYARDPYGAGGHIDTLNGPIDSWDHGHPHAHTILGDYIVGSVSLSDGRLCGTDDPFHGVSVTAMATLANAGKSPLGTPVRVNAWGDYALPANPQAAFVKLECENAPAIFAAIDSTTHIAATVAFPGTGVPTISSAASTMTATVDGRNVGIFLPPELGAPSDHFPSGELFLAFKGLDSQKQACEYYRSLGAAQSCDAQGNPVGGITFDDWKKKVGMDPYVRSGGQEVDAAYINRIDLNLTRRHHAVAYASGTPPVFQHVAVQAKSEHRAFGCGIRSDRSLACWGNNPVSASIPSGAIKQIGVPQFGETACAIKDDSTLACWGDNNYPGAAPPSGTFAQVSVGTYHACALDAAGNATCWGLWVANQNFGQTVAPPGLFSQISAGDQTNCGIRGDGTLACWGWNGAGMAAPPGGSYRQVSAGATHACAVRQDSAVICWGDNAHGQTDVPKGRFVEVVAGRTHSCGLLANGSLTCWGDPTAFPKKLPKGRYTQLAGNSCALNARGVLSCWNAHEPEPKNQVAAYVCNHLGPKTDSQEDVDKAIDNALAGRNLVACVAMDYGRHPGPEADAYVGYYIFAPNGELMTSINLDGRQEKYVPGTCVVCHGGDKYDGHFPADGHASPDYGGHFLPYDTGNFAFSSKPGLTKADQEAAIHKLNSYVLKTNTTEIERTLINAWYASGTGILDEHYVPADWRAAAPKIPSRNVEALYTKVHARYCRTCHVALERTGSQTRSDNPEEWQWWGLESGVPTKFQGVICGGSPWIQRNHTMPNSLVTFNRLWSDQQAIDLLSQVFGPGCANSLQRDPKISDPTAVASVSLPIASPGTEVGLTGGDSVSLPGQTLTYHWDLDVPPGSGAALTNASAANPSFTPDVPGPYIARLTVHDGNGDSVPSTSQFTGVYGAVPVVAEIPFPSHIGDTITLDGTQSHVVSGGALTYHWSLSAPAGSHAVLTGVDTATPSFTIDRGGNYTAALSVTNSAGESPPAYASALVYTVSAQAESNPLTGAIPMGRPVMLDASKSASLRGNRLLNYSWSITGPDGSHAVVQNSNQVNASFTPDLEGNYSIMLMVDDGDLGGGGIAFLSYYAVP